MSEQGLVIRGRKLGHQAHIPLLLPGLGFIFRGVISMLWGGEQGEELP